jgi:putative transposase
MPRGCPAVRGMMGKVERPWQETRYVLSFFGSGAKAREEYLRFVERGVGQGRRPELVGGGLIRSLGGWAEVLSLRSRRERQAADQRVPGSGEFVETVLSEADEFQRENLRLNRGKLELRELAEEVCKKRCIGLEESRSGIRRGEVVAARREFGWQAVRKCGYSGAEVARFLGVPARAGPSRLPACPSGDGQGQVRALLDHFTPRPASKWDASI